MKLTVKGGAAVDPDSGLMDFLEETSHVSLVFGSPFFLMHVCLFACRS